jgi:peptidoglycan/xylan/chitin deacetylase (PgdA/CDA1 family)
MRIRGTTMLRRYARRVANTLLPGALILNYHRVAEPGLDPWELCVSPGHFDEHLDIVRRLGRPTQLSQLTEMLRDGKPIKGAVAITFDDGYLDNYETARPLLEKHGIPATIFVVSGSIGSERGFWWDELAALLLRPGRLPSVLELSIRDQDHRIELSEASHCSADDLGHELATRVWQARPGTRLHLYNRLWSMLRPLGAVELAKLLDQIRDWAGGPIISCAGQRTMSARQLRKIADGGLIEIGGHTVSHPILPCHSEDHQKKEIDTDKTALEQLTGSRLTSFAYPFGDYCPATVRLVKAAGYQRACSTVEGHVRSGADPFLLSRCRIRNCSGEELSRRLFNWAHT